MAGLANREDDVLDELRQDEDVGHVRLERLVEQGRGLARANQDHRGTCQLADRGQLVDRQDRAARGVQDDLEMASGQNRRGGGNVLAGAQQLELVALCQRLEQRLQTVTGAGYEDARGFMRLLAHGVVPSIAFA